MRSFIENQKTSQQIQSARFASPARELIGQNSDAHSILHLQRTIGNQAAQRLSHTSAEGPEVSSSTSVISSITHDFSQISIYPERATKSQPWLMANTPRDLQERSVDRGAKQVVSLASDSPEEARSFDQRLSEDLFEKREVGQLGSGVNFEATATELPSDEDIAFDPGVAKGLLDRARTLWRGEEQVKRLGWEGNKPGQVDEKASTFYPYGFRWVQTIKTNDPLNPGVAEESVDGEARKGVEPYYNHYSRNEKGPGKFEDYPTRQLTDNNSIEWLATLALVGVEQPENRLEAYDVHTYGFKLSPEKPLTASQLANREKPFHKVDPIFPKQDWSAFQKHRSIVEAAFPDWEYSMLKAKPGAAEKAMLRLLLGINPVEEELENNPQSPPTNVTNPVSREVRPIGISGKPIPLK